MPDEIRATSFVVVDEEGNERARLGVDGNHVGLTLLAHGSTVAVVSLGVNDDGNAHLRLEKEGLKAELQIGDHKVSLKLADKIRAGTSCGMSVDDAGAWVVAEGSQHVGVRMMSKSDGEVTFVWLSEKVKRNGEDYIRSRYIRTEPEEDEVSGWRTTC